jgi:ssDNA-binding Zn-finger/Zn-ribbon topoisomerase 1
MWSMPLMIKHRRFGWFWECPNGENCQYRHALPPGFVLKSQKKAAEEAAKANTISIEEFLEVEVCVPLFLGLIEV